ncbi:MAG TPA: SDR family oxidoreductase [Spirochaetota bacterium]|nr:SDR family oxidoreductase [Spirochaetota bacterium]HSA14295.1 SDR family oxidoreductase [Spirochaetota bacterium]
MKPKSEENMAVKKTALVTGATSGIGRAFAEEFARRGYDLIVTGRREKIIRETARSIEERFGVNVKVVIAELSEEKGVRKVLAAIRASGGLHVLVNNAGFGLDNIFIREKIENHLSMVHVHVDASIRFIHAALPAMIERRSGVIINVSSLGAWVPGPLNSIYGGTKAFLNVFSESLQIELRAKGIRVQALCPGFTSTDFHAKMGVEDELREKKSIRWMRPEDVVACSMKALEKNRVICVPGFQKKLLVAIIRMMPKKIYTRIMEKMYREYLDF